VYYAIDLYFFYRTTGHGGKQNTAQRIAQGVTESALKRLKDNLRTALVHFINLNMLWRQKI
jgi:hypothetical protein